MMVRGGGGGREIEGVGSRDEGGVVREAITEEKQFFCGHCIVQWGGGGLTNSIYFGGFCILSHFSVGGGGCLCVIEFTVTAGWS